MGFWTVMCQGEGNCRAPRGAEKRENKTDPQANRLSAFLWIQVGELGANDLYTQRI